jgi:hypothetical protein
MTPEHLAEIQAAWPGKWVSSTTQDDAMQLLIRVPDVWGAAFVDDDGLRWACIDYRTTQAYLYEKGPDFATAVAALKRSIDAHIAPFRAALESMP